MITCGFAIYIYVSLVHQLRMSEYDYYSDCKWKIIGQGAALFIFIISNLYWNTLCVAGVSGLTDAEWAAESLD